MIRLLVVYLMLAPVVALGVPSITGVNGTLETGQPISILGSSFGSNATPSPLVWQDFNDGTNEAELTTTGVWSVESDNVIAGTRPKFSNTSLRDGSGLNAHFHDDPIPWPEAGYSHDMAFISGLDVGPGEKVFASVWARSNYQYNPATSKQWKLWRLSDGPVGVDTYPDVYFQWNGNGNSVVFHDPIGSFIAAETGCAKQIDYNSPYPQDQWFNIQVQASMSSGVLACDADLKVWIDGSLVTNLSGLSTVHDMASDRLDVVRIGEYFQNNTIFCYSKFDDVFVDDTWARVEIGDRSSYGDCTHREVMSPETWGSNSITATCNTGSFVDGSSVFLFVVDDDGSVSSGYGPLTVSSTYGGGDTTPPAVPTGVSGSAGNEQAAISWSANSDSDLAGYYVYRSSSSGAGYFSVSSLLTSTSFNNTGLTAGQTYYYVVRAVDTSGNQSSNSSEVSVVPTGTPVAATTITRPDSLRVDY